MRILITGFVAFVIWCFVSAWLYNDILLPLIKKPAPVAAIPEKQTNEADSLIKLKALMPKDLTIYFGFDDSRFKPDAQTDQSVAEFKAWLNKYSGSMVSVTGHTDLVGTEKFNMALGHKRAQVVSEYLKKQGIAAGRIMTESKGESQPVATYVTKEGRAKNRRTEISIIMH
jgi:outer membrane protein OmpA-like peptidoglycan-associated protein